MIGHELHRCGNFSSFLVSVDKDLAESRSASGLLVRRSPALCQLPAAPRSSLDDLPEDYPRPVQLLL